MGQISVVETNVLRCQQKACMYKREGLEMRRRPIGGGRGRYSFRQGSGDRGMQNTSGTRRGPASGQQTGASSIYHLGREKLALPWGHLGGLMQEAEDVFLSELPFSLKEVGKGLRGQEGVGGSGVP